MKEKLVIKNFGPIKDVELELGRFNVLIGEQATGKSTVAKLLSFCRYFSNIEGGYFEEETQENKNHGTEDIQERLSKWGLLEYVNDDCFVSYECEHYKFSFDKRLWNYGSYNSEKGTKYRLISTINPVTSQFKNLLDEYFRLNESGKLTYEFYEDFVSELMDNPFFIPTERGLQSIFSLGKDSSSNMADPLFRYFVEVEKITRNFKNETDISPLNIQFKVVEGKSQIKKDNEEKYFSLVNAASGYQSAIPIILLMKYYEEIRRKPKTFIIEEPELSLFPNAQNELVKFFAEKIKFHNGILLTTHSPYILTSLNNLIYAYKVGQGNKKAVNEIIAEKYWIDPSNISAYKLVDGTARNIVDADLEEILVEELDEAGKQINTVYDKILDIKFQKNEKSERLSKL